VADNNRNPFFLAVNFRIIQVPRKQPLEICRLTMLPFPSDQTSQKKLFVTRLCNVLPHEPTNADLADLHRKASTHVISNLFNNFALISYVR